MLELVTNILVLQKVLVRFVSCRCDVNIVYTFTRRRFPGLLHCEGIKAKKHKLDSHSYTGAVSYSLRAKYSYIILCVFIHPREHPICSTFIIMLQTGMICYTDWMTLVEKDDENVAELWVLRDEDLWPAGKKLKVRFLDDRIPPWPNDRHGWIDEDQILKTANEWHECGRDVVPEFVPCGANDTSDIRVKYIGK